MEAIGKVPDGIDADLVTTDRAWAWVVAFAGMVNVLLSGGMFKIFGMLMVEVMETFEIPASEAGLLLTTFWVSFCIVSFLVNFTLGHIFHERVLVVVGGIAGACGMIVSFFATRATHIIFVLGIFSGMNMTLGVGCSLSVLGKHFRTRLSLANSITMSGAAFATLILPPLVRYLLDEYRLHGTLLILGGLTLNMVVSGTLLRPSTIKTVSTATVHPVHISSISIPTQSTDVICSENSRTGSRHKYGVSDKRDDHFTSNIDLGPGTTRVNCFKKLIFKEGERPRTTLREVFAMDLLKKPLFVVYQLFTVLSVIGCNLLVQFLPSNAKDLGFRGYQTATLLSILGVSDLLGRIINGVLGDTELMKRYKILMASQFVLGISAVLSIFAVTFWSQIIFSVIVGIQIGVYYSSLSVVLVDFFGAKALSKSQGVNQLAQGFGMTIGITITGYLRDISGNYAIPFIVIGSLSFTAGLMLFMVIVIRRFKSTKTIELQKMRHREGFASPDMTIKN